MPTVVGVRLRFAPKTLWFDPAGTVPAAGDSVIVETERGTEIGVVSEPAREVDAAELAAPLKPVTRVATAEDLAYAEELEDKEREAFPIFRDLVREQGLDMKPVDVEFLFGGDKVVFYFSAEERVDFRDLVKELASRFRARIDMRQVGVRDEARMVGGLGHCGEQLCCVRFGGEFQPVSIRMAKEQDLPLNPLKISGLCGRLMCCLRYEFDAYKDFKGRAPKRGALIDTPLGKAKVSDLNTPRETVTMRFEDGKSATVPLASMTCAKGSGCPCSVEREVLEEASGSISLVFAALDREKEPVPAPPPARKAEQQPKSEQPRKRRRRGGGGGGAGADKPAEKKAEAPKPVPRRAPKPEGGSQDAPEGADGAKPARSGRRRRRRRSGGGGSTPPQAG